MKIKYLQHTYHAAPPRIQLIPESDEERIVLKFLASFRDERYALTISSIYKNDVGVDSLIVGFDTKTKES